MTIRSNPPISLSDVMAELRIANPGRAYPISLGDADVRALAGKPSGAISLSDLYGKSGYVPMSVSATGGYDSQQSQFGPGTASASATAVSSGGRGVKTFLWNILGSTGAPSYSALNTSTLTASKNFSAQSNGSATVTASCRVTDETGASVTSNPVSIELDWYGTQ